MTPRNKRINIFLTGNPNVGKSIIFSRLTGVGVISSNFPGTTVEYLHAKTKLAKQYVKVTDIPGAYSLKPTCKAEDVACQLLGEQNCDFIIHVMDATNLERNLYFALDILKLGKPTIILLNKWDLAKLKGITIDHTQLSEKLGVPVIPFVGITGEGVKLLESDFLLELEKKPRLPENFPTTDKLKWEFIGKISKKLQTITHKHPTFLERLGEFSIRPISGTFLALATLVASFFVIREISESLIGYILTPAYEKLYLPKIIQLVDMLNVPILKTILIGSIHQGTHSFGLFTEGVSIPFISVLPYVFSFYLVIGFLEDIGYLPRLAVLLDTHMHRLGLHGSATIPVMLGLGCKVPGVLGMRVLESRREKMLVLVLMLLVAPCIPQSAMIISILSPHGLRYVFLTFFILFTTGVLAGTLLNKKMKGDKSELFLEIPPYSWPYFPSLISKVWFRVKGFVYEAIPLIILGVLIVNLLFTFGAFDFLAILFAAPIKYVLGLPPDTVSAIILGFLRKDVSIALLIPYSLTAGQLVIASVFMVLYFPCIATLLMIFKEMKLRDTIKALAFNLAIASAVCATLNAARHVWMLF
jgi:ferrous iron transport protein B